MRRLRKKRKKERELNSGTVQSKNLLQKIPTLEQLSNMVAGYLTMIQLNKALYFNPKMMTGVRLLPDGDQRMAVLVDDYLKITLSLTYHGMGEITEEILQWILLDTPVSREAFSLIKNRYQKYFKK